MIDAAFHHGNGKTYYFGGNQYLCVGGPGDPELKTWPGEWSGMFEVGGKGIDAALRHGDDITYMFQGARYMRYHDQSTSRSGSSAALKDYWKNLLKDFAEGGIDAAVRHGDGNSYFFCGSLCVRVPGDSLRADNDPQPIKAVWKGLPDTFNEGIDAALHIPGSPSRTYFFAGRRCVQFTGDSMEREAAPRLQRDPPGWIMGLMLYEDFLEPGQVWLATPNASGNGVEVKDSDGKTVDPTKEYDILPGGGIVVRCQIPEPYGPRLRIHELNVYRVPRNVNDEPDKTIPAGKRSDYHNGDASLRCTRTAVFLKHKHGAGADGGYYFGVTFEGESGELFKWDPEVRDTKRSTGAPFKSKGVSFGFTAQR